MAFYFSIQTNPLQRDCHALAEEVLTVMRRIQHQHREFDLTRQIIRSVVSVGSNVIESKGANSRDMLSSKLEISYREASEARFQISILERSGLLDTETANRLDSQLDSIAARLYSAIRRIRSETSSDANRSRYT